MSFFPLFTTIVGILVDVFGSYGVLAICMGFILFMILAGIAKLPIIDSIAIGGIPFLMYSIYGDLSLSYGLGILIVFYGLYLYGALRNLLRSSQS